MPTTDRAAVANVATEARARGFLGKAREYLADGDLHQASEKGWGAAAHMAKAAAEAQGWDYDTHADFSVVMHNAAEATGEDRLLLLRGIANELHGNYYRRSRHLRATAIGKELDLVAELVDLLAPLAAPTASRG